MNSGEMAVHLALCTLSCCAHYLRMGALSCAQGVNMEWVHI